MGNLQRPGWFFHMASIAHHPVTVLQANHAEMDARAPEGPQEILGIFPRWTDAGPVAAGVF
jgi:hypothetical protein